MRQIRRRFKPHVLLAHEALLRRLKPHLRNHPTVRSNYQRHKVGFYGETQVDFKLSLIDNKDFIHIPGVRLRNRQHYFQIDSIILTPKVIFVIEIKNLQGTLEYYSSQRQLVQITVQAEQSYKDPILQVRIQVNHFKKWLGSKSTIPVEHLVVSTNPATVIKNKDNEKEFNHRFLTLENLIFKIDEIYQSYQHSLIKLKNTNSLAQKILHQDIPRTVDLIDEYGITTPQLIDGIPCSNCKKYPLVRKNRNWHCKGCGTNDKSSHERVILDYFLLHKDTLTNIQTQRLLNNKNRFLIYRILSSMKLITSGSHRSTHYHSPKLSEFPQNADIEQKYKIFH